MDIVREDCVPTIWRYLLYHVRYKTAFPHRADVLNKYHAKVAKHRARGTLPMRPCSNVGPLVRQGRTRVLVADGG
jgi:hypothetical protein